MPHPAATLIVLDRHGPAPRILMGHRRATARFMPSAAVFPGGRVDPADHHAAAATQLHPVTFAHLARAAAPDLAHALAIAAARELLEETHLSLGDPPRLHALRYLCRAVTPPGWPIRFDARFLVIDRAELANPGPEVALLQQGELERLTWHTLDEASGLALTPPTAGALDILRRRLSGAPWPDQPNARIPVLLNGATWEQE